MIWILWLVIFLVPSTATVEAQVPKDKQLHIVNEGDLGDYIVEYGASYRAIQIASDDAKYQMVFFNTTPNAFELAIRLGRPNVDEAETMRFVWSANRDRPVRDGATLSFGADGNLVLADVDGTVVFSTNTTNSAVVGLSLRHDGNLVLLDNKNATVWHSFDSPTDSLLVGQTLRLGQRLYARVSDGDGGRGPYSLAVESGGIALYDSTSGHPEPYWTLSFYDSDVKNVDLIKRGCLHPLAGVTYGTSEEASEGYPQTLDMTLNPRTTLPPAQEDASLCGLVASNQTLTATYSFTRPRFPTDFSFLRLDWDGNLRFYAYTSGIELNTWDVTYERFDCDVRGRCGLPGLCGALGLCNDSMCVACPGGPRGELGGWSPLCKVPTLPACGKAYTAARAAGSVGFYEVAGGAEHFSLRYVSGKRATLAQCRQGCLAECECKAFFYFREESRCFQTYSLRTLSLVANSSHVAYIKTLVK